MIEYLLGHAVLDNKDEGPAIVKSEAPNKYEMMQMGENCAVLADLLYYLHPFCSYSNLRYEIEVDKFGHAHITPLNKKEMREFKKEWKKYETKEYKKAREKVMKKEKEKEDKRKALEAILR